MSREAIAARLWDQLGRLAARGGTTFYSEIAPRVGTYQRSLSKPLGLVQAHCAEHGLPPLTILVTRKGAAGTLGSGFESWRHADLERAREDVFREPWLRAENPWQWAKKTSRSRRQLVAALLRSPLLGQDVVRLVRARNAVQGLFREALLDVYGDACAFCELTFLDALEAAHIVPWAAATPLERGDVRNGLLLCANHHRLFDAGEVWLDDDWRLQHRPYPRAAGAYTVSDKAATKALNDCRIRMPKETRHRPLLEYLARRTIMAPPRRL